MSVFLSKYSFIKAHRFTTIKLESEGVCLKTFIKLSAVLTLQLSILLSCLPAVHATPVSTAVVTADILNVREKPQPHSKRIGTLKKGTPVTVYAQTKTGWSQIHYKSKKAYVSTRYLKFTTKRASYLLNRMKIYTYKGAEGTYQLIPANKKFHQWDVWYHVSAKSGGKQEFFVREDRNGLYTGYINSEYYIDIKYPVKLGQKWDVGYEGAGQARITSTAKTIKTPAGTFKNTIEVKDDYGYTFYFAKNIGLVKCIYHGKTYTELVSLKEK